VTSELADPTPITTPLDDALDLSIDSLLNAPEHIGYLKSLGLDFGWGVTSSMEWVLEHVHILAGTPWWVSISLTAVLVRAVLFRAYVDASENSTRVATIQPITKPITAKMTAALRAGDNDAVMKFRQELQLINKRAGIKTWKMVIPLIQAVAGFGTFRLLNAMGKLPVPGLETGGALWFYNLSIPDPYMLLPLGTASLLHLLLRVRPPLTTYLMIATNEILRGEVKWVSKPWIPEFSLS
jgi:YidC/Oxa1 family membrane protein insertase